MFYLFSFPAQNFNCKFGIKKYKRKWNPPLLLFCHFGPNPALPFLGRGPVGSPSLPPLSLSRLTGGAHPSGPSPSPKPPPPILPLSAKTAEAAPPAPTFSPLLFPPRADKKWAESRAPPSPPHFPPLFASVSFLCAQRELSPEFSARRVKPPSQAVFAPITRYGELRLLPRSPPHPFAEQNWVL